MGDESPKCKACGTELQGRDIYEGTCKRCREEAVLGAPAPARKPKPIQPSAPAAGSPPPMPPADSIAIEATVDLDADTKEIPAEEAPSPGAATEEPAPEAEKAPEVPLDSDVIPGPFGPADEPKLPFVEIAPPAPAQAPAAEAKQPEAAAAPTIRHMEKPMAAGRSGVTRSYDSFHGDSEAPAKLGRPMMLSQVEQPLAKQPAAAPAASASARLELAPSGEERPAPAEPPAEVLAEVAPEEPKPRERRPAAPTRRVEAPPAGPAVKPEALPARPTVNTEAIAQVVKLQVDAIEGKLKALIDDLAGQVEQLSKVLTVAHQASPQPFWFGFRAFFGFLVGMGALAAVAAGLLALVGTLFYPPALDLLKQIFTHVGPR